MGLSQVYLQVPLDKKSPSYCAIKTHHGLYRCKRLPFGVANNFPKIYGTSLAENCRAGVICYIDDIVVSSKDERTHLKTLEEVLTRREKHGLRIKMAKCYFLKPMHQLLPMYSKYAHFLWLLNDCEKFIPKFASILHPLIALLQTDRKWSWTDECAQAFQQAKDLKLLPCSVPLHKHDRNLVNSLWSV